MELRKRLALVALAYLLIFLVGGFVVTNSLRTWTETLDDRRDLLVTGERIASLKTSYLDQETAVRGFVISNDPSFLDPYQRGVTDAERLAPLIRHSLVAQDIDPQLLDGVASAGEQWQAVAAAPVVNAATRVPTPSSDDATTADEAKNLFDDLRLKIDTLSDIVSARLAATEKIVDSHRKDVITALAVVIGLVILLTAIVAWLLQRWVVRPLAAITVATERVSLGEAAQIEVTGPKELRDVATAVGRMQSTILKQRDTAVNARQAFEQNAVLALQIRDELAHEVGDYPAGWSVAAGLRPAEGLVAGDCYDVSLLGPTEIGLVVLDIAGHGALAAISAFRCKELLKVALRNGLAPGSALDWLAGQELNLEDGFFTAFVATIDTTTGRCYYANAGHPPALLRDADHQIKALDPTGPLFGHVSPGWRTEDVELGASSVLTVYTDGLIEARNPSRDFYGEERLMDVLMNMQCSEAQPAVDHVLNDLSLFHRGRVADDVTLVVLCRIDGETIPPAELIDDDAIEGKDVGQSFPSIA